MQPPNKSFEIVSELLGNTLDKDLFTEQITGAVNIFQDGTGNPLPMPVEYFFGHSMAILGMTGSGKSQTVKRVMYELHDATGVNMTFFDPDDDYYVMKEVIPKLKVYGRNEALRPQDAARICEGCIKTGRPVVISLLETDRSQWPAFVISYLSKQWEMSTKFRLKGLTMPHINILEEAQVFLPQTLPMVQTERTEFLALRRLISDKFAGRGRKRGPVIVLVTQRVPKIFSDSVTQVGIKFLHNVKSDLDVRRYVDWIGQPFSVTKEYVGILDKGMCILSGDFNEDGRVHVHRVRMMGLPDVSKSAVPGDVWRLDEELEKR